MSVGEIILRPVITEAGKLVRTAAHTGNGVVAKTVTQVGKSATKVLGEGTQKILNKISAYYKRIPNAKLNNPVTINLDGNIVGFTMDRTLSGGKTKIILKDLLQEGKHFSARVPQQSSLQILLDENGQMISGDLCTHLGFGITDHVNFERTGKNIRRITYDGTSYMPVGRDNHWVPVTQTQTTHASMRDTRGYLWSDAGRNNNLAEAIERSTFGEFLMHLADLKINL